MEAKDGSGCVSIRTARVLAFRRPHRPRIRLLETMRARLHVFLRAKHPDESLLSETKANLSRLGPKVQEAHAFIDAAKGRMAAGELDDTTFYSETLPARTVLMLHRVLQGTMEGAVEKGDADSLSFVNIAAQVLLRRMDRGSLLRKVCYPGGSMQVVFLGERISVAQNVFDAVNDALDGANVKHNVEALFPPQD